MLTEAIIAGTSYLVTKAVTKKVIGDKEGKELVNKLDILDQYYYDDKEYDEAIDFADEIINEYEGEEDCEQFIQYCELIKARSYYGKGSELEDIKQSIWDEDNKDALEAYKTTHSLLVDYGNKYGYDDDVCFYLAMVNGCLENYHEAQNFFINLLSSSNDTYRSAAHKQYDNGANVINGDAFVKGVDYEKRKYIYIGRDKQQISGTYLISDKERIVDWIFTINQLHPDIEFPLGRPQPGLYMAHPIKTEQYFPMKNAEETLFMEKVREFSWLVQCLGAREVSFHSNKGMSVSEGLGSSMNVEANVGIKSVNVGGSYGNSSRYDGSRGYRQQVECVQHFDPKKKAYCPDDLVWLDSDPAWKDLIKQRLNGNMLDYTYKISSSETCQMSSSEKDEVKANFEYMMVKVNGSYNSEKDNTFSSIQDTEWSIHVEFAPMSELKEDEHSNINNCNNMKTSFNGVPEFTADVALEMNGGRQITEAERPEYERRLKANFAMPVDGVYQWKGKAVIKGKISTGCINISEESRIVIVDSFRNVKYGTCEGAFMFNRVLNEAECDDNCGLVISGINPIDIVIGSTVYLESEYKRTKQGSGSISSSEQDYLDEVKETIEDYGKIGPIERKHLEKTRNRLGISERRAAELEASINQVALTDDEQEYLDEVKEVREDYGEIGPKERKYLEKTRVRLGISVERAEELERM